jgi:CheY-like chemotaxis protein
VIRILVTEATLGLADLSLAEPEVKKIRRLLAHRSGIVILSGPTGSGKTTTLYGGIQELSREELNIVSVEDPIEYDLGGITQIQVEPRRGVTFPSALRAILRQDPDVIFIGEIRDLETAEIAAQAAMTGHLVLTTLHTTDALSAMPRLLDLGLDASSMAATVRGLISQRLLRRLCADCGRPADAAEISPESERLAQRYRIRPAAVAVGCRKCWRSGYRGRIAIAEVIEVGKQLEELVAGGASWTELRRAARRTGTRFMQEVALERVRSGETTLEEVDRVLGEVAVDATPGGGPASRVLEVDDDPVMRVLVRNLLSKQGYRVAEARDGVKALELLADDREFDLVVLDLDMPRLSGEQCLRKLKSSISTAGIPVIVLTGSGDGEEESRLIDLGAIDYIRKPIDEARFVARVNAALRRVGI